MIKPGASSIHSHDDTRSAHPISVLRDVQLRVRGTVGREAASVRRSLLLLAVLIGACPERHPPGLDAKAVDAALIDAGEADGSLPDASSPDAGTPDAGTPDASAPDAGPPCPADMVYVPSVPVCIDPYEASQGAGDVAQSVAGALPWVWVNWHQAGAACAAAGKRLCALNEWSAACTGPAPGTSYPYGDAYDPLACNGADNGLHHAVPTGSMATCEGGYAGLFDMSGNVGEWTATCGDLFSCELRGGSFDVTEAAGFLRCDTGGYTYADYSYVGLGFRCCVSP